MSENAINGPGHPVDAVILWVDGSDPVLASKIKSYLREENIPGSYPGAQPTCFASNNEIRYCVLSILKFAPFIRNIFIVTDGQDPGLSDEVKTHFPGREKSIQIVDHSEIYRGYEHFLPVFNSSSIQSMIWRIEGLSENFIYFNDDVFLIREHRPEDWFINNRPVLRGKWQLPPLKKIVSNYLKILVNKNILKKPNYQPRISFYLRQWRVAHLLGWRLRYFFHCHTPHPLSRSRLEKFFDQNRQLMEKTISYRFRNSEQLLTTSVAYHMEIEDGNTNFAKLNLGYFHPCYPAKRIKRRMSRCQENSKIKSVCVQSLDMMESDLQEYIFKQMDMFLDPLSRDSR